MSNQPWNVAPGQAYYPQPPKKRKVWLWVGLAVVVMIALCGVGSIVLAGAGVSKVAHDVHATATARASDVTITDCSMDPNGLSEIGYKIHNSSSTTQSYVPQFNIESSDGTVFGEAADFVNNLAPGKDYMGKATGTFTGGGSKGMTCNLVSA